MPEHGRLAQQHTQPQPPHLRHPAPTPGGGHGHLHPAIGTVDESRVDWAEWKAILRGAGVSASPSARDAARGGIPPNSAPTSTSPSSKDVLGHADVRTTRSHQNVGVELTRQAATAMEAGPYGPSQPLPPRESGDCPRWSRTPRIQTRTWLHDRPATAERGSPILARGIQLLACPTAGPKALH